MKEAIINYGKFSTAMLVERGEFVAAGLAGNATFPTPPITAVELTAMVDAVKTAAVAADNRDRAALSQLRDTKLVLVNALRTNGRYVNTVAAGNETLLLSSGFAISKTPEGGKLPEAIRTIDAKFTNIPRTIALEWSRSKHARFYNVFMSSDNGATWTQINTVSGRKLLVSALASNTRYQFKVVPIGAAGEGVASDIASQIAA